jgi:hypothetical protein
MDKIGAWFQILNKYIPTIFRKSPCFKCLVKPCCQIKCEEEIKWENRYDIFLIPFFVIVVLLGIIILIPFFILANILGIQMDAPEDPLY